MPLPTNVSELNTLLADTALLLTTQQAALSLKYISFNQSEHFFKPAFDITIDEYNQWIMQYKFIAGELSANIAALDQIQQHQQHLVGVANDRLCITLATEQTESLEETLRISETILGRMAEKAKLLDTLQAHIMGVDGTQPGLSSLYTIVNASTKVYTCFELGSSEEDNIQDRLAARLAATADSYDDDISWPSVSDDDTGTNTDEDSNGPEEMLLLPQPTLLLQFQQLALDGDTAVPASTPLPTSIPTVSATPPTSITNATPTFF